MLAALLLAAALDAGSPPPASVPIVRVWEVAFAPLKRSERRFASLGPAGPFYPADAARDGETGSAILECVAGPEGVLNQCRVYLETPPGSSFGAAALRLAQLRRIRLARPEPEGTLVRPYVPFRPAS